MYLKKLFDHDSFTMFDSASNAKLARGAPQMIMTLTNTLKEIIFPWIPRRVRLIKMMDKTTKIN